MPNQTSTGNQLVAAEASASGGALLQNVHPVNGESATPPLIAAPTACPDEKWQFLLLTQKILPAATGCPGRQRSDCRAMRVARHGMDLALLFPKGNCGRTDFAPMALEMEQLGYGYDAFEPHLTARTVELHHARLYRSYIDELDKLLAGTPAGKQRLTDIIRSSSGTIFRLATQVWNHDFYWRSMCPDRCGSQPASVRNLLARDFGSVDDFQQDFATAAKGTPAPGWTWLVIDRKRLRVRSCNDVHSPLLEGWRPLLVLDMHEHAYYLDYQDERERYVDVFVEHLINWEFIENNIKLAARSS